jgi:SagB-type dehydrogenase family enzyme
MSALDPYRDFLKADLWEDWRKQDNDQKRGVLPPPVEKPYDLQATLIALTPPAELAVGQMPLIEAIRRRRSHRQYTEEPLTIEELAFLLWATQGIGRVARKDGGPVTWTFRTVPSGGARHPFETYLMVNRVTGLEPGLYRYLAMEHKLCALSHEPGLLERVQEASNQNFVAASAVTFIWTAIPYRTEWRYSIVAPKLIAQDSGHLCQNLYLACEAIGAGTCAVGAYSQAKIDHILGVDGENEFTIYMAPVGKVG